MSGPGQSNQKPDTSSQVAAATMPPPKACFCQKKNTKRMKQCDSTGCNVWAHFECINITQRETPWYCESCPKSTNSQQNANVNVTNVTNVTNVQMPMVNFTLDSSGNKKIFEELHRKDELIKEEEELNKKQKELDEKIRKLEEKERKLKEELSQLYKERKENQKNIESNKKALNSIKKSLAILEKASKKG